MKRWTTGHIFSLSFLLIAIISIAVVFSACGLSKEELDLEISREATDAANIRSAFAEVVTEYLVNGNSSFTKEVRSHQQYADWQGEPRLVNDVPIPACTDAGQTYVVGIILTGDGACTPKITIR